MQRRPLLTISLVVCACVFLMQDSGLCFGISPTRIELSVVPGTEYQGIVTVKNDADWAVDVSIRLEDWHAAIAGRHSEEAFEPQWLTIEPRKFELRPQSVTDITYRLKLAKEMKGEVSAMMFFEGKPKEVSEGASVIINTSIGLPMYIAARGTEKYRAGVEKIKISKKSPIEFLVSIKNSGNVHIRPTGDITLRKKGGRETVRVSLNKDHYPIMPNSTREIVTGSEGRLESGKYHADVRMIYNEKQYRK
ncbi:MAG: hypothetical protein ABH825_03880, partial [Candidatus Omnitrophota bacterium]